MPEFAASEVDLVFQHDNAPCHTARSIRTFLQENGLKTLDWPPQSPDLSPIELCWSKFKEILSSAKARTLDALDIVITNAINVISEDDAINWFHHCGLFAESIR